MELTFDCAEVKIESTGGNIHPLRVTLERVDENDVDSRGNDLLDAIDQEKIREAVDVGDFCDQYTDDVIEWLLNNGYTVEER